jgi:primary-amine oxidase
VNRVEDWPVMPVEIYQIHFKPSDFFERNPAIDMPNSKNESSVLVGKDCCSGTSQL